MAFHQAPLYLRTWFSTNDVDYELLEPDTRLNPLSFADFDTAALIVVEPSGRGDFLFIQDALDYAAEHVGFSTILLMPGHYMLDAPLAFPTNRFIRLVGAGERGAASIERADGAALHLHSAVIENLTVRGHPAIAPNTAVSGADYMFIVRRSNLERAGAGSGPAVQVTDEAHVVLEDVIVRNEVGGAGLRMGEVAHVRIVGSRLESPVSGGTAISVDSGAGFLDVQQSVLTAFDNYAILADDWDGAIRVSDSDLRGGIATGNTEDLHLVLRNSQVRAHLGTVAVLVAGRGFVDVGGCDLTGEEASVVAAQLGEVAMGGMQVNIRDSSLRGMSVGQPAVSLISADENDAWRITCTIRNSSVAGLETGISIWNSQLNVLHSSVSAETGIWSAQSGEVRLAHAMVDAELFGVSASNSIVEATHSLISAEGEADGAGLWIVGESEYTLQYTEVAANGDNGIGILANLEEGEGLNLLAHSLVSGEAVGLYARGGEHVLLHSTVIAEEGVAMILEEPQTSALVNRSTLITVDPDSEPPVIRLTATTDDAPGLQVIASTLLSMSDLEPDTIDIAGALTGADIVLVQSVLSHGLDMDDITIIPADDTTLPFGNVILP